MATAASALKPSPVPMREPVPRWSLVVAVNNERVFRNTLLASPALGSECQLIVESGHSCAGNAYNAGLDRSQHEIVVFAHQDVYLPAAWMSGLRNSIEQLWDEKKRWAVLGSFGVTRDIPPELKGYCYSTGLGSILGEPFALPIPARTLDEMVLVLRRSSGLRFDRKLPGFHLYGGDICLQAEASGLGAYIIPAFCIHNANGITRLPYEFWQAYMYLRRKWRRALPVRTCCTTITRGCLPVARRWAQEWREHVHSRQVGERADDVTSLYQHLCRFIPEICESGAGE